MPPKNHARGCLWHMKTHQRHPGQHDEAVPSPEIRHRPGSALVDICHLPPAAVTSRGRNASRNAKGLVESLRANCLEGNGQEGLVGVEERRLLGSWGRKRGEGGWGDSRGCEGSVVRGHGGCEGSVVRGLWGL